MNKTYSVSSAEKQAVLTLNFIELCKAMLAADIPFWKLENSEFVKFLQKYTGRDVPHESTLRKGYLSTRYDETVTKIREHLKDSYVWISIEETADCNGRYIANVVIGELSPDKPGVPYHLTVEELEVTNSTTVARRVNDAMKLLWPDGIRYEQVLLF